MGAYKESDDFVPDPTHQFGTVDTSGTAGMADNRIEEVTNIFETARQADLETAKRALDPKDTAVSDALVVLPAGPVLIQGDPKEAAERVKSAAAEAEKAPLPSDTVGPAQRAAAEGDKPKAAAAKAAS